MFEGLSFICNIDFAVLANMKVSEPMVLNFGKEARVVVSHRTDSNGNIPWSVELLTKRQQWNPVEHGVFFQDEFNRLGCFNESRAKKAAEADVISASMHLARNALDLTQAWERIPELR